MTSSGSDASTMTITPDFSFRCDSKCAGASACQSQTFQAALTRYQDLIRPSLQSAAASGKTPPQPTMSASGYWWEYAGDDCDGTQYDLGKTCESGRTPEAIEACKNICAQTAGCSGFNTHGILKNSKCGGEGTILDGAGCGGCVDLYLLRSSPEPGPGNLTTVDVCLQNSSTDLGPGTNESYSLFVPAGDSPTPATLTADTMFGALHGLESLVGLIDTGNVIRRAPVQIDDQPRLPFRGLMIDTGRHYLPVEHIRHVIDGMAMLKLNVLHWHLVDEQSFAVKPDSYPQLADGAFSPTAVYTSADLRSLVQYAKERGVRIQPEFDMPGHGAWGKGMPEIMGCDIVLDPTSDHTYQVLEKFLMEMSTIFTDQYLFLGGDEVDFTCWDKNPNISTWLKQHNMTSSQLQQYFWQQMRELVLPKLNKTLGVWENDKLQIDPASLPADSVVNVYQSLKTADLTLSKGIPTVVSIAGSHWYLDSECGGYNWNAWRCVYDVTLENPAWKPEELSLFLGGETCMWGEGINLDNFDAFVWHGAAAAAEKLWSPVSLTKSSAQAAGRLVDHMCLISRRGIGAGPILPGYCPSDEGASKTIASPASSMYSLQARSSDRHGVINARHKPDSSSFFVNLKQELVTLRLQNQALLQENEALRAKLQRTFS